MIKALVYLNPFKDRVVIKYEDDTKQVFNNPTKELPLNLSQYITANKMAGYDASKLYKWTTYRVINEEMKRHFGETIFVISDAKGRTPDIGERFQRVLTQYAHVKPEHVTQANIVWMVGIPVNLEGKVKHK